MRSFQSESGPVAASIAGVLFLATVIGAGSLTAQVRDDPRESARVSPDDLFRIRELTEPNFHPDGQRLSFVVTQMDHESNAYQRSIWEADLGTGDTRRLTWGDSDQSPHWSPDGDWLAFRSSRSGSPQLWVLPTRGGEARQVTELESGVSALTWAPDSRRLAVVSKVEIEPGFAARFSGQEIDSAAGDVMAMDRLRYRAGTEYLGSSYPHLFVVSVEGGAPVQITEGPYEDSEPAWSPDGRRIAFVSNRTDEPDYNRDTNIFIVDASGGEAQRFSGGPGTDAAPRWTADGSWLAFRGNSDAHDYGSQHEVWVVGAAGGEPRNLTKDIDHSPGTVEWAPSDRLLVSFMVRGNVEIHALDLNGEHHRVVAGKGQVEDFDVATNGALAYLWSTPTAPTEAYLLPTPVSAEPRRPSEEATDGSEGRALSHFNDQWRASRNLADAEEFWYRGADDWEVQGWVMKPAGFRPEGSYPLILEIHGGPYGMYGNESAWSSRSCLPRAGEFSSRTRGGAPATERSSSMR